MEQVYIRITFHGFVCQASAAGVWVTPNTLDISIYRTHSGCIFIECARAERGQY